jgi:dTMP kinase
MRAPHKQMSTAQPPATRLSPWQGRGRFITLEGGEGAGKSTQIKLLAAWLRKRGLDPLLTREPGGSPAAESIRDLLLNGGIDRWLPMSEALLLSAARHDHAQRVIGPALAAGRWVLCDRFADSTLAYQGYGHGLALETLRTLTDMALADLRPDLTLIFDIDPAIGLERAAARRQEGEDRYERMRDGFHERLRQGFLAIAAADPRRCATLDASRTPEAVQADIRAMIDARLLTG